MVAYRQVESGGRADTAAQLNGAISSLDARVRESASSFMKWELSVATDTTAEVAETETRPDLAWDDEVRGLCVRVYRDCAKLFIFVYRIGDRQRFIRIGQTPVWSLEAARIRAKELHSIVTRPGSSSNLSAWPQPRGRLRRAQRNRRTEFRWLACSGMGGSAEEEEVYLSVLVRAFNELGYIDSAWPRAAKEGKSPSRRAPISHRSV